jgi:hypothetical protein
MRQLRQMLNQHLNLEEVRLLCFDLHIEFDDLLGETKKGKIAALLQRVEREQKLTQLLEFLEHEYREVNWRELVDLSPESAPGSMPDGAAPNTTLGAADESIDAIALQLRQLQYEPLPLSAHASLSHCFRKDTQAEARILIKVPLKVSYVAILGTYDLVDFAQLKRIAGEVSTFLEAQVDGTANLVYIFCLIVSRHGVAKSVGDSVAHKPSTVARSALGTRYLFYNQIYDAATRTRYATKEEGTTTNPDFEQICSLLRFRS